MKLNTDVYLNKAFNWQNLGVYLIGRKQKNSQIEPKINFLAQFRPFLNISFKKRENICFIILLSLFKNVCCFWGVLTKSPPKSSLR